MRAYTGPLCLCGGEPSCAQRKSWPTGIRCGDRCPWKSMPTMRGRRSGYATPSFGDAVTVRPGIAVFDRQKGILATQPATAQQTADSNAGASFNRASKGVDIGGKIMGLFDIQNAALGAMDGGRAAANLGRATGWLGAIAVPAEHGFEGVSEVQRGAPAGTVAAGVAGKTALHGGGILGGMGAGAVAGAKIGVGLGRYFPTVAPVLIPTGAAVGSAAGAILGGEAMGKLLENTSNEAMGRKVQAAGRRVHGQMEALGRNPYGYGAF